MNIINMDVELQVAVQFIISFLTEKCSKEKVNEFTKELRKLLTDKFEGHWYPEKPAKGSAYRCLSVENHLDALLIKAAESSNVNSSLLSTLLPKKLDLWIDPTEVSYRIGEHGPVIVIYKEGDDCVNSTSEYLAKVLNQLPTVTEKEPCVKANNSGTASGRSKQYNNRVSTSQCSPLINTPQIASNISVAAAQRRIENHLSPAAKSFVSRNALNIPYLNNHVIPQAVHPLLNLEYLQKLQWPLLAAGGYDPLAAQLIQNYLIMQELQRFETRRLALQSHYLKMQNMRWPKKSHHSNRQQNHTSNSRSPASGLQISA